MKAIITKIVTLSIAAIIFYGMAAPASATIQVSAVIQDELWQKAQKIARENHWIPGLIEQHETVLDKKGKLMDDTRTELQLSPAPDEQIAVTVLKSISDGKDTTKKARKKNEGVFSPEEAYESSHPFTLDDDTRINVTRLDRQKTLQGKNCVAFQYNMTSTSTFMDDKEYDITVEGIAWLDEMTGVPYEVENRMISQPIKAKKVTIKTLQQIERYSYIAGEWLPRESETNLDIEVRILLFKFKGKVKIVSFFSDYWEL